MNRLSKILTNLFNNAVGFTNKGEIRVTLQIVATDSAGIPRRGSVTNITKPERAKRKVHDIEELELLDPPVPSESPSSTIQSSILFLYIYIYYTINCGFSGN